MWVRLPRGTPATLSKFDGGHWALLQCPAALVVTINASSCVGGDTGADLFFSFFPPLFWEGVAGVKVDVVGHMWGI